MSLKNYSNPNETQNSFIDVNGYDNMDPSLADGFQIFYDKEIPFELRLQDINGDAQEVGTLESIRVKILLKTNGDQIKDSFKVELTSEADLFFHYTSMQQQFKRTNIEVFDKVKSQQKLNINFNQYISKLQKLFDLCFKEPHKFFAVYFMQQDGYARLDFIENLEYKFIELFSVDFTASNEEIIRHSITYRYNLIKVKSYLIQNKLSDVNNLIKLKNPSLLMQIQKGSIKNKASTSIYNSKYSEK